MIPHRARPIIIIAIVLLRAGALPAADQKAIIDLLDVMRVAPQGNTSFTDRQIRLALQEDHAIRAALRELDVRQFRHLVCQRVITGYRAAGFAQASATGAVEERDGRLHLVLAIDEGQPQRWHELHISAPADLDRGALRRLMTQPVDPVTGEPLEPPGQPHSLPPLWQRGEWARFDRAYARTCERAINAWLGRTGQSDHRLELQVTDGPSGAICRLRLQPAVGLPRIASITVAGVEHHDPQRVRAWLASELDLRPGVAAGTGLLHRLRQALYTSGCVLDYRAEYVSVAGDPDQVICSIAMTDHPDLPLLYVEKTPLQRQLLALREDLLARMRPPGAGLTCTVSDDAAQAAFAARLMLDPRRGATLALVGDYTGGDAASLFHLGPDRTVFASSLQDRRLETGRPPTAQVRVSITAQAHPEDADGKTCSLNLGLGMSTCDPAAPPLVFDLRLDPACFLILAARVVDQRDSDAGPVLQFADGIELGLDPDGGLRHLAGISGDALPGDGLAPGDATLYLAPGCPSLDTELARLGPQQTAKADSPPADFLTALLDEALAYLDILPLAPESAASARPWLQRIRAGVELVVRPVAALIPASSPDRREFVIPSPDTPRTDSFTAALAPAVQQLAITSRTIYAADDWPYILLRDSGRFIDGDTRRIVLGLQQIATSPRSGPLAALSTTALLALIGHPAVRHFANAGRDALSAEACWNDLLVLLGGADRLGAFLGELGDPNTGSLILPPPQRAILLEVLQDLRGADDAHQRLTILRALFDQHWDSHLQPLLAGLFDRLAPGAEPEAATPTGP